MSLANIHLTEEQRQQLLDLLQRRFKKMTDCALLELERLTRHAADLTGFQAVSNNLVITKAELIQSKRPDSDEVIDGVFSTPISRREFMAYTASGLLSLILGYGWWKSDAKADDLSGTLDGVGNSISHLSKTMVELQRIIYSLRGVMADFQSMYQPTIGAIMQLNEHIKDLYELYLPFNGTGRAIADILRSLADFLSLLPGAEKYTEPVSIMAQMAIITPDMISTAGDAMAKLSIWFSNEGDRGINSRVFIPADSVFQMIENEIKPDIEAVTTKLG